MKHTCTCNIMSVNTVKFSIFICILYIFQNEQACHTCGIKGANLWLCLVGPCQHIGCGESAKDHSSEHANVCVCQLF